MEKQPSSSGNMLSMLFLFVNVIILKIAYLRDESWYWALLVTGPCLLLTIRSIAPEETTRKEDAAYHGVRGFFIRLFAYVRKWIAFRRRDDYDDLRNTHENADSKMQPEGHDRLLVNDYCAKN